MILDCSSCAMQGTAHCEDCVVAVLVSPSATGDAVVVDADEERAIRELSRVGLVPEIRMRPRSA